MKSWKEWLLVTVAILIFVVVAVFDREHMWDALTAIGTVGAVILSLYGAFRGKKPGLVEGEAVFEILTHAEYPMVNTSATFKLDLYNVGEKLVLIKRIRVKNNVGNDTLYDYPHKILSEDALMISCATGTGKEMIVHFKEIQNAYKEVIDSEFDDTSDRPEYLKKHYEKMFSGLKVAIESETKTLAIIPVKVVVADAVFKL